MKYKSESRHVTVKCLYDDIVRVDVKCPRKAVSDLGAVPAHGRDIKNVFSC